MNFPRFLREKNFLWQANWRHCRRTVPLHIKVTFIKLPVSALVVHLPSECQAWSVHCGRSGGTRPGSPTSLWITVLCSFVPELPLFPLSASLLFPHTWAECSVVARKPGLLNADFKEVAQERQTVTFRIICMKSDFTRHKVSSLADDASFVLL